MYYQTMRREGTEASPCGLQRSVLPSDGPQRSQRKHKINTRVGNEEERQWHATKPRQGNKRDKEETTCLRNMSASFNYLTTYLCPTFVHVLVSLHIRVVVVLMFSLSFLSQSRDRKNGKNPP